MMRRTGLAAVILLLLLAGFSAGGRAAGSKDEKDTDIYEQLDLLMEVFERIRADYVEPVDDKQVLQAAIQGMLTSLDPHSSYLPPKSYDALQFQMEGEYGGLGLEVTMDRGVVLVVSPIRGTPGERAGIRPGDYITHIDGKPILGLTLDEAVEKMRGPVGEPITLTIMRKGEEEPIEVELVRDKIVVPSVEYRVERGHVGYLAISSFNEQTAKGVEEAFRHFDKELGERLDGVVIDLRNDPGGLLDQAVAVADHFLERGEIVSVRGRHERDNERWNATPGDLARGAPIIVLINAGSASASEIVAGALQDHRRATLLGEKSFGKGTVQHILSLGEGRGALRITTARYYTPSGRSIQELGITPDIPVKDPRLGDRRRLRREKDLARHLRNDQVDADDPAATEDIRPSAVPEAIDGSGRADGERGDGTVEDAKEPKDFQLEYALDLLDGVHEALAGRLRVATSAKPADARRDPKTATH